MTGFLRAVSLERDWHIAERILHLRVLAAFAWVVVCGVTCLVGDWPERTRAFDAACGYLVLAGALLAFSRWSRTTHAGSLATLLLLDAPVVSVMQGFAAPFPPGTPALIAVSVWAFAYLLLAAALTLQVRNVIALGLEALLLQALVLAHAGLADELIGYTLAALCVLSGLAVPITTQLVRAMPSKRGE